LKVNAETFEIESKFHEFVRPSKYPMISELCTSLSGITQEDINNADSFKVVLQRFDEWFMEEVRPTKQKHLFITCGDWDMMHMMPTHCSRARVQLPWYMRRWHSVKESNYTITGKDCSKMPAILKNLQLDRLQSHNKSIDDLHNIRNIALELANRGLVLEHTRRHPPSVQ